MCLQNANPKVVRCARLSFTNRNEASPQKNMRHIATIVGSIREKCFIIIVLGSPWSRSITTVFSAAQPRLGSLAVLSCSRKNAGLYEVSSHREMTVAAADQTLSLPSSTTVSCKLFQSFLLNSISPCVVMLVVPLCAASVPRCFWRTPKRGALQDFKHASCTSPAHIFTRNR